MFSGLSLDLIAGDTRKNIEAVGNLLISYSEALEDGKETAESQKIFREM